MSLSRAKRAIILSGKRPPLFGVNLSGGELAPWNGRVFANLADAQYLASKGVTFVRLQIAWESIQTALSSALDATYLASLKACIASLKACGIGSIVDVHNFGYYVAQAQWTTTIGYAGNAGTPAANVNVLGDATVTSAAFVDLWNRLSTALVGTPGLIGYGLMNEPTTGVIGKNIITTPSYFLGGDWNTNGTPTITALGEGTSPLGATYGPAFNVLTGGAADDLGQGSIVFTAVPWTLSVYAKVLSATQNFILRISGTDSTAQTATTAWQRFSFTRTPSAGAAAARIEFPTSAGVNFQFAHAQLEIAGSATSFEPSPYFSFAQAAITAIRAVDATTPIYVNGYNPRSSLWIKNNPDMASLTGTNLIYETHQYFDGAQGVGGGGAYSGSYASYSINAQSGTACVDPALAWGVTHGVKMHLGECGVPTNADAANWLTLQNNVFSDLRGKGVTATQWYYGAIHGDGDKFNLAATNSDPRLLQMLAR